MDENYYDSNGQLLTLGSWVEMFGMCGVITEECGACGVGFPKGIDWDKVEKEARELSHNEPRFLHCDNFVSLWELLWNFYGDDVDEIDILRVVTQEEAQEHLKDTVKGA